jgi:type II secretory pathway pseudopilin PulG
MVRLPKLREHLRSQHGYTLVELIVAATMFIVISVVAVGVLVSVLNSSSKTAAQRSVQQDARVNIEEIARTVRSSSLDYEFYEKADADGQTQCQLPANATGSNVLPLIWNESVPGGEPNRKRVIFFYDDGSPADDSDGAVYRYEAADTSPVPSCAQLFSTADKVRLTADNIAVTLTKFFVSPLANPYKNACPTLNSLCQVRRNTHPRATIVMTVRTSAALASLANQSQFSQTTVQTTVGTRAYLITGLVGQQ